MPMPAKSAQVHELQGTRSRATTPDESRLAAGRPSFPRGISRGARAAFKNLCGLLEQRRALTRGDGELLALYAVLHDRHRQAQDALQREGLIVNVTRLDSNGQPHDVQKPNMHLRIAENCERQMVAILDALGLTPRARDAVKPTKEPAQVLTVADWLKAQEKKNGEPA